MSYGLNLGVRYLRARKSGTVLGITAVATVGVAVGVSALLVVLAITGGFEHAFQEKVLGVNAHFLIRKPAATFLEYDEVAKKAATVEGVKSLAPFVLHEMMIATPERPSGVLVKGVDAAQVDGVLALGQQMVKGGLSDLRAAQAHGTIHDEEAPSEDVEPPHSDSLDGTPDGVGRVLRPEELTAFLETEDSDLGIELDDFEEEVAEGQDPTDHDFSLPTVIIGATLANELKLKLGDTIRLISPLAAFGSGFSNDETARAPASRDFEVVGVFKAGFQEYDARLVYVDIREAMRLQGDGDSVSGIEGQVDNIDNAKQIGVRIGKKIGSAYDVTDWHALNRNMFRALANQKVALSFVIGLITMMAAVMVVVTLIIMTLERKRQIAILKTMGATDRTVLTTFLVQGAMIGIVGTVAGLILGAGVIYLLSQFPIQLDPKVYLIDHLPVTARPTEFLITAGVACIICFTATFMPSMWAARLSPIDGLKRE